MDRLKNVSFWMEQMMLTDILLRGNDLQFKKSEKISIYDFAIPDISRYRDNIISWLRYGENIKWWGVWWFPTLIDVRVYIYSSTDATERSVKYYTTDRSVSVWFPGLHAASSHFVDTLQYKVYKLQ